MKKNLLYIFLITFSILLNSKINSCVSPDCDQFDKVYSYNLERYVKRSADKFIYTTGFNSYTIPAKLLPEYELKIREIISRLRLQITNSFEKWICIHNVEQGIRSQLGDFKKKLSKIVLPNNLEYTTNRMIQKLASQKRVSINSIPYHLASQYLALKNSILYQLHQSMVLEDRNYVRKDEIKQIIHKELDQFFDQVKRENNYGWNTFVYVLNSTSKINFLNTTCPLCKNKFLIGDRIGILNCNDKHFFHEGCIKHWFTCQKNCPTCLNTKGADGKDLIIAQIETISSNYATSQTSLSGSQSIQNSDLNSKVLEISNQILNSKGINLDKIPARVVSDYNDKINKIKDRLQTIMNLENRNYVTKNEIETVANDELKSVINKIKYVDENCSICLEHFRAGDKIGILNCNGNHFFHKDCISAWLNSDNRKSCPLCRQENLIVAQIEDVASN